MIGTVHHAHGNGLVHARKGDILAVARVCHVIFLLGDATHAVHGRDRLNRILARGGLGRKHDGIGAVEHGVGHVGDFGARRHRAVDHGFHHLGGGNDRLVHLARELDQAFLNRWHRGIPESHRQVTAHDHDRVRNLDDLHDVLHRLGTFDLGDNAALAAGGAKQSPRLFHVRGAARERNRQIVGLDFGRDLDVFPVLVGQCVRRQPATLTVDTLVVRELATDGNATDDRRALDFLDPQRDASVVEQQRSATCDVLRQLLVGSANLLGRAGVEWQAGVNHEARALGKHGAAVLELAGANLRTLQIYQHADLASVGLSTVARGFGALDVDFMQIVGKIEPYHVNTGFDQPVENFRVLGNRPQRGDDFSSTQQLKPLYKNSRRRDAEIAEKSRLIINLCVLCVLCGKRSYVNYFFARCSRISTAGSFFPSRNSRNAPPAVEIYDTLSKISYFWIAAMVSPPPARGKALVLAIASAIVRVAAPNWANSNTPPGPFHTTVPAFMMMSASCWALFGPMSKIMSSSATPPASFNTAFSLASNFLPAAARKVLAMPPPATS